MENVYIAVDFETTGLDAKKSEFVEIGAVKFTDDGEVLDTFQCLAKPVRTISVEAENIHGISSDMLVGMDSPRVVWQRFLTWAGDFTALVAHNAQFESLFIQELYANEDMPDFKIIDTLQLSKNRLKGEASYKLTDLVNIDGSHRALPDAHGCVELFLRAAKTYKSGKVPHKTYMQSVSAYVYVNPTAPTERQLAYIAKLGGNPGRVSSKKAASDYIDRLKTGGVHQPTRQDIKNSSLGISPGQMVIAAIIVAGIISWLMLLI